MYLYLYLIILLVDISGIFQTKASNEETSLYLFLECPYSRQVWKEVEHQTSLQHLWDKATLEDCFQEYFIRRVLKEYRTLPYLITWESGWRGMLGFLRMSKLPLS
jgi:hypothetical protein